MFIHGDGSKIDQRFCGLMALVIWDRQLVLKLLTHMKTLVETFVAWYRHPNYLLWIWLLSFEGQHADWFKQPNEKESTKEAHKQSCFNQLIDADKDPREFELQEGSTFMFAKKIKRFLKKDKITRTELEGPAFELLKNRFRSNVEL
ncbi:hypothetical protein Tco_1026442 [Tanacetum coccineum]